MKTFKFITREKVMIKNRSYTLHASSNTSIEDAQKVLQKKVEIMRAFSLKHAPPPEKVVTLHKEMTGYNGNQDGEYTRAIFEEILEEIDSQNCISRNYYEVAKNNTKHLYFRDVDTPQRLHLFSWIFHLFSGQTFNTNFLIQKCKTLLKGNTDLGIRLYQSFAGFRLILSGSNLTPPSERPHVKILRTSWTHNFSKKNMQRVENDQEKFQNVATCRLLRYFGNIKISSLIRYHDARITQRYTSPLGLKMKAMILSLGLLFGSGLLCTESFAEEGACRALQNTPVYYPEQELQQVLIGVQIQAVPFGGAPTLMRLQLANETPAHLIRNYQLWTSYEKPYLDFTTAKKIDQGKFTVKNKIITYVSKQGESVYLNNGHYLWVTAEISNKTPPETCIDIQCKQLVLNGINLKIENPSPRGIGKTPFHKYRVVPYFRSQWMPKSDGGLDYGNWDDRYFKHITDIILFNLNCDAEGNLTNQSENFSKALSRLQTARQKNNPKAHILLGLAHCKEPMRILTAQPPKRAKLIAHIKDFLVENKIDGIDVDWEYPQNPQEWNQFSLFIAELKEALFPYGMTVSAAINAQYCSPPPHFVHQLDFVNIMSYDSHPGPHSPFERFRSDIQWALQRVKLPRCKIVPGLPFYGMITAAKAKNGATCWDSQRGFSFIYGLNPQRGPEIDTYDDPKFGPAYFNGEKTLQKKCQYAVDEKMGGVMIWGWDTDIPFDNPRALIHAVSKIIPVKAAPKKSKR